MADFCQDCSIYHFGEDFRELAGLCKSDKVAAALCEGCGSIWVDHEGVCQSGCQEHESPRGGIYAEVP